MQKMKIAALTAAVVTLSAIFSPIAANASANSGSTTPYVALGADLTTSQKATVYNLLGIQESQLNEDTLVTITNSDEHQYLDGKVPAAQIGTRALSSCKVTAAKNGSGITVETHNINYVTPSMYENALATAGAKDANVVVAAPSQISGTAALVGAMKAYSKMEGQVIQPQAIDSATDELVTTSQVAKDTGDTEKTTQLVAAVKQVVAKNDLSDDKKIGQAVDDVSNQLNLNLSDKDRQLIIDLMKKISKLDLDANTLSEQAQKIYKEIQNSKIDLSKYGISKEETANFFTRIINAIKSFFN